MTTFVSQSLSAVAPSQLDHPPIPHKEGLPRRRAATAGGCALVALSLAAGSAWATTPTCPATAIASDMSAHLYLYSSTNPISPIGPHGLGANQRLWLTMTVEYTYFDQFGRPIAFFSDGTMTISKVGGGFTADATPDGGVALVGEPGGSGAGCGGALAVRGGKLVEYPITDADRAAGSLRFEGSYANGTAWFFGGLSNALSRSLQDLVRLNPHPACSIVPPNPSVAPGGSVTLVATGTAVYGGVNGAVPQSAFSWTGPNGFSLTGTNRVDIANAQAVNLGTYTNTVTDEFGCSSSSTATLTFDQPIISDLGMYAWVVITGASGRNCEIQYTTDLKDTNSWVVLTNITPQGPSELWVDTTVNVVTNPRRFYRVVRRP